MNGDKEELEWWSWISSGWWRSQSGDGQNLKADSQTLQLMVTRTLGGGFTEHDAVRSIEVWQAAEAFKAMTRVTRRVVRILDRSAVSSSVHSIYKNQHLSFISFTLRRNYIVRASLSPVRAYPFTSFSNDFYPLTPFLSKWFYPFTLIYLQFLYLTW